MDGFVAIVPPLRIESPCTLVCTIDRTSGLCLGCNRTRDEIARWSSGTAEWRMRVIAELPSRVAP